MRFADIIIDLASVVKASRSVASKHLELRSRQLDRYGQTSTIVQSLRQQGGHRPPPTSDPAHSDASAPPPEQSWGEPGEEKNDVAQQGQSQNHESKGELKDDVKDHGWIPPEQRHVSKNLFRDSSLQKPATLQPDQGSILDSLKRPGNVAAERTNTSHSSPPSPAQTQAPTSQTTDDAPAGVDINVFRTSRASQLLGGQTDAPRKPQALVKPPTPSWFKDFGHGKGDAAKKGGLTSAPAAAPETFISAARNPVEGVTARPEPVEERPSPSEESTGAAKEPEQVAEEILSREEQDAPARAEPSPPAPPIGESKTPTYSLRESKVPSTRLGRLWNYGGLAAGMLGGAISEGVSRGFGGGGQGSVLLSAGNMERLVAKLSRMRGAALKMGQMMSFQDAKMLPAPIQEVLQRVQDRADYMPAWQRDRVLAASLGPGWREELFDEFEELPIAAASIGQVHRATLKSTGRRVAVKVQFPGVADSINSDLDNLSMLLTASKVLPKGLYLNKTIDNARTELGWECDYEREAACGRRYRELLADERDVFAVPEIFPEASGRHVLTMEFMEGVGVTRAAAGKGAEGGSAPLTQEQRDWIGTQILRLCLREIAEFHFMQTDPNWTNFLYNAGAGRLELLDFGASREYPAEFVSRYLSLLAAASRADRAAIKALSEALGYLTGHESRAMVDAHTASILTLAEPFLASAPETYDFRDQTITERVKALIPVMVRERLSPPPEETYSLHRKLSGAFLLCARLGSRVRCRELFENALRKAGKLDEL